MTHLERCRVAPRLFVLVRDRDHTGVSGEGVVAEGVQFSTGRVALHWIAGGISSTALHDSLENVEAIHGHGGSTRVVFLNGDGNRDQAPLSNLVSGSLGILPNLG